MKQSNFIILVTFLTLIVFSCLCISVHSVNKTKERYYQVLTEDVAYQQYITKLASSPMTEDEIALLDLLSDLSDTPLTVYIPLPACGACAITLIQMIYNNQYSSDDVSFFFDDINIPVMNEVRIHRFHKIKTLPVQGQDILMLYKREEDQTRCLKYFEDNPYVVNLFLNSRND